MKIDRVFSGFNISAKGLTAQRRKMNAIAENLANAETSRTEKGVPYKRKIVEMTSKGARVFSTAMRQAQVHLSATNADHMQAADIPIGAQADAPGTLETNEREDSTPPRMVYDPGNPEADDKGYVQMPNVNVVTEMVGMISASRAFEANVTAINAAKAMAKDSLDI